MKTFNEFKTPAAKKATVGFPSFSQVREGKGDSCVSEKMHEMMKEMLESSCNEMMEVHGDASEMTAESWMKEYDSMIKEYMEGLQAKCNEYMSS